VPEMVGDDAGMPRVTSIRNGRLRWLALGAAPALLAALAASLAPAAAAANAAPAAAAAPATCQHSFVPAYPWSSSFWTRAINSKPAPAVMILNVTGTGAGTTAVPHFQALVRQAQKAGIAVLGYSSTEYGQRAAAAVEADAKNYKAWYKVNGMFLDLTANARNELPYYRGVAKYIRAVNPGSVIWLNVGAYPAQGYMSVGNVVVAFEGSYASYRQLQVPAWTAHYRPARFADVIYATPRPDLAGAVSLSRQRRTGYMYVTNLAGSPDPYTALPGYWGAEVAALAKGCPASAATKAATAAADVNPGQALVTSHRESVSG
jgi:glutathione peroxidase-family protein